MSSTLAKAVAPATRTQLSEWFGVAHAPFAQWHANEMESEMSAQHTQGQLKLHTKYPQDLVTSDGHYTVARTLPQPTLAIAEANARRLVACWNAFYGTSTLTIESMTKPVYEALFDAGARMNAAEAQRDELLNALRHIEGGALDLSVSRQAIKDSAHAAISKAEGGAA